MGLRFRYDVAKAKTRAELEPVARILRKHRVKPYYDYNRKSRQWELSISPARTFGQDLARRAALEEVRTLARR